MNSTSLEDQLRRERNESWARFALLAKDAHFSPATLCLQWSQEADLLLQKAFKACFADSKIALFSLGKLGSHELNLSSDVDLLFIADNAEEISLSALRKFQHLLGARTPEGFVFRIDFDLRPGGRSSALIPTLDQFIDYYGNYGETWERLALVRLRFIDGDLQVRNDVEVFSKKFSFRKHLDFTLLNDLKSLRSKIQSHHSEKLSADLVNLKLGVGGIRDVELFTHALQVVHGGRDSSLQVRGTSEALQLIKTKKLLPAFDADFLIDHYWNLRQLENYVQSLNDEQTHLISPTANHPEFIKKIISVTLPDMQKCDQIVRSLLGEASLSIPVEDRLKSLDISGTELEELWNSILHQEVLSREKARDEAARKEFLSQFLDNLKSQNGNTRRALLFLKDFIQATRAKASFFTLLLREPTLLSKLTWLFGHSPYLSKILCNRPELLDSFVFQAQHSHSNDLGILLEELAEKRLLSEVINGGEYFETLNLKKIYTNLTSTADSISLELMNALKKDHPSKLQLLALGKWGGKELGFRSDLDFIFVSEDIPSENDFKLARRFISRLTESHRGGNIYSIDMRLRPSGSSGPLVIQEVDLFNFLQDEAPAWVRQAYTKARWIGVEKPLPILTYLNRGLTNAEIAELEEIRIQLNPERSSMNLKYSPGGLTDTELAVQTYILLHKLGPADTSLEASFELLPESARPLSDAYFRLRQIEQMLHLVASESVLEISKNDELFQLLASALRMPAEDLWSEIETHVTRSLDALKKLDPRRLGQ